jgi:quinol monooxygenase YgiN
MTSTTTVPTTETSAADSRRHFLTAASVGGVALAAAALPALAAEGQKPDTCVGLVPYFDVNPDKLEEFKALGPKFIALTRNEEGCLYYGFSFSGNTAHCREGYRNADAVLAHLKNVDAPLKQALAISKIARLEVHGPAAEVDKLREPLKGLSPQFFVLETGAFRV